MENLQTIVLAMDPWHWLTLCLVIIFTAILVTGFFKKRDDDSQVFITWALYCSLDFITMQYSNKMDGNYILLFGCAIGSFLMAIILFIQGRINWTWRETILLVLVVSCVIVQRKCGYYWGMISGIMSEILVGIYLAIRTFKHPIYEYNLIAYCFFLIASILSFYHAPNWSIEQIGYPGSEIILTSVTIFPLLREYRRRKRNPRFNQNTKLV